MLTVSISQAQILCGSFSSIPKLSVNNIRPRDSLVFELAARGSVEDLKLLFAGGKANVHDHDPNNWSLLHVGTNTAKLWRSFTYRPIVRGSWGEHIHLSVPY